jgi:hypothetical protein
VARLYGIDATYPFFMLAGVQLFIGIVGGFLVWRIEARSYQSKPLGMELVQESA